ncbi:hypothetical protein PoB_003908500 [Plakobranchus ocellatus]|uniref:Uncharacterized protein n=1 Tax=Plakobranchus ocellatus TaxID=259542 RepID=A0AAV4AW17_9GAST|nr:hypothetical protein PoB_003908500 [Plakobranchus ocellatus]
MNPSWLQTGRNQARNDRENRIVHQPILTGRNQARDDRENRIVHQPILTGRNQARDNREPYRTSAHLDREKPSKRR